MHTPLTIPFAVAAWLGDRFVTRLTIWAPNKYAAELTAGADLHATGQLFDTITVTAAC